MSKEEVKYDELSADDILNFNDLEVEELIIEEWKGKVYMRTFSGTERAKLQTKFININAKSGDASLDVQVTVFVMGVCDAEGTRLFSDDKKIKDKLKLKRGNIIEQAATLILKYNGLAGSQEQIKDNAKN